MTSSSAPPVVFTVLREHKQLKQVFVPELDHLLECTPVETVEFSKSWDASRFDPFVRIHTSGSTGIPKLVTLRHGSFSAIDAMQTLENDDLAHRLGGGKRVFSSFPQFHVAGITYNLAGPCWVDSTIVLPPPGPLDVEVVNTAHVSAKVGHSLLPPSVLVDIVKNEDYSRNLSALSGVLFAGGPLPQETGDFIASRTNLMSSIGTTEANMMPQLPKDQEDWQYFRFNTAGGGLEFRQRDSDIFEMVIVRRPELDLLQPVFVTFPNFQEFETKDLYEKHPLKPGLWKYKLRLDDIIVLSNGEKLNPVTMESIICTCPIVNACIVVGQGHFQAAAVIEVQPEASLKDKVTMINSIWPFVQKANAATVNHGRIAKQLILLADPAKPFAKAGKGTIQRAATTKLYEQEIEALYHNVENSQVQGLDHSTRIDFSSPQKSIQSLHRFMKDELQIADISDNEDFFALGIDSLQLISLVRAINTARPSLPIDLKHVYNHPSIVQLVESLHSTHPDRRENTNPYDSDDEEIQADWIAMGSMYKNMTRNWTPVKNRSLLHRDVLRSSNEGPIIQPDRGVLAWLQVVASFLLNINNWGLINTFGAFQAWYELDLLRSYSPSAISWIGTLQGSLILLVGVLSGPIFDSGYFQFTVRIGYYFRTVCKRTLC